MSTCARRLGLRALGTVTLSVAAVVVPAVSLSVAQPDPVSSFLQYRRQLDEATSAGAVLDYLLSSQRTMLGYATESELVSWFDKYRQKRLQRDLEVLGQEPLENGIRLRARGTDSVDGRPLLGRIDMRLETGTWRIAEEVWYPDFKPATNSEESSADFAEGFFSVDGNEVEMRHAYVKLQSYWADRDLPALELTISDKPIDPDAFGLRQQSDAGELHYFVLTIGPDQMVTGGMMYHQAYEGGYVSLVGVHSLEATRFGPTVIEGRVFTENPAEFNAVTNYSVAFRATILPEE